MGRMAERSLLMARWKWMHEWAGARRWSYVEENPDKELPDLQGRHHRTELFAVGARRPKRLRENEHLVICHDLDSGDANSLKRLKEELESKVRHIPKRQRDCICIVIPVQEIEAWFLADVELLKKRFKDIRISDALNPEAIASPKEYIEKASRDSKARPRYIHNIHNPELARELDIDKVHSKCPAFRPFHAFIIAASERVKPMALGKER